MARTKQTKRKMGNSGSRSAKPKASDSRFLPRVTAAEIRAAEATEGSFPAKDPNNRHDVLLASGDYYAGGRERTKELLAAIRRECWQGEEAKAVVSPKQISGEPETSVLTFPGHCVATMFPQVRWSRMRNYAADAWRRKTLGDADSFVFLVDLPESTEEYFTSNRTTKQGWEQDRFQLAQLLRKPELVENHRKPLLLLVQSDDEGLDLERVVNLLGLDRLGRRPFRAVLYSSNEESEFEGGVLKEALEWLAKTASSKEDDESTAAVTGFDTEDEASAVGSTTTASTFASSSNLGHYILDYEPTLLGGNPTLQRFEPIKKGTHCPFAKAAKLWGGKLPDEHTPQLMDRFSDSRQAAMLNAGPLAEFAARALNGEALDGFCLQMSNGWYATVARLGETVLEVLTELAKLDPSGENAIESTGPIDSPQWRFRFAGEDFFLTTFSPVYDAGSSRYSFGVRQSFILFQPMTSFGRHGLAEDTPASATNWTNPTSMRDKARAAFKENGCPYHIPEELPYPVAEHVVKPMQDDGTSVVRWWEGPI